MTATDIAPPQTTVDSSCPQWCRAHKDGAHLSAVRTVEGHTIQKRQTLRAGWRSVLLDGKSVNPRELATALLVADQESRGTDWSVFIVHLDRDEYPWIAYPRGEQYQSDDWSRPAGADKLVEALAWWGIDPKLAALLAELTDRQRGTLIKLAEELVQGNRAKKQTSLPGGSA